MEKPSIYYESLERKYGREYADTCARNDSMYGRYYKKSSYRPRYGYKKKRFGYRKRW